MPGTAADPVKIGPWKRIKEVHWPARWVVVKVDLAGTINPGDPAASCSPFAPPPGAAWDVYCERWSLDFETPTIDLVSASGSTTITSEATVTGLPTPTAQDFGPWEIVSGAGSVFGFSVAGTKGRWVALTGPKVDVPSIPALDNIYYQATTADAEGAGDVYTGGSSCSFGFLAFNLGYYCTGSSAGEDIHAHAGTYGGQSLDFSGVSVGYRGKSYAAVGIKVESSSGIPNPGIGTVWILCRLAP